MATTIWMIPWCLQRCWSLGGSGSWTDTAGGPHPCWSKSVPTAPGCTPSGWYICTERGRETVNKSYLCVSYSITMFWFILQTGSIIMIFGCFLHILYVMVSLCWNVKKPTSRCYSNNTVVSGSLHRELGSRWKLGVTFRFFHQHICAISEYDHLLYGNCLSKPELVIETQSAAGLPRWCVPTGSTFYPLRGEYELLCFHFISGLDEFSPLGFMVRFPQIYEVLWSPNVTFRPRLSVCLAQHRRLLDSRSHTLLWQPIP